MHKSLTIIVGKYINLVMIDFLELPKAYKDTHEVLAGYFTNSHECVITLIIIEKSV